MKAEFEYSAREVEQIVLDYHQKRFTVPEGLSWEIGVSLYGIRSVKIEAVEKAEPKEPEDHGNS